MARARASGAHEGSQQGNLTDALKRVCERCGGAEFFVREDDLAMASVHATADVHDLLISATGGFLSCIVYNCAQCGQEQCDWWILDTGAATGAAITMTNLDQATTADLLVGCYAICQDGTDAGKYYTITANTAAAPTVLTVSPSTNNDEDGTYLITNRKPCHTAAT